MTKDQLFFTATISSAPRTYDKDGIKSSQQGGCVTWQTMAIRQSQKSLRPSRGAWREKRPKKIPLSAIISSHGRCQVDTETMFSIHLWNNECFKKCFQVFSCFVLQSGLKTVFNPVEICERRITWTFCAQTSDPVPMQMATRSKEIFRCPAQKVQTCTG